METDLVKIILLVLSIGTKMINNYFGMHITLKFLNKYSFLFARIIVDQYLKASCWCTPGVALFRMTTLYGGGGSVSYCGGCNKNVVQESNKNNLIIIYRVCDVMDLSQLLLQNSFVLRNRHNP